MSAPLVPRIEPLVGSVDGANVVFWTPVDYLPGSVRVFRNGVVSRADHTDGWTELGGNKIRVKEAPETEDILQAYYVPL